MYKFLPYMTNDYSTGLFDEDVNDIYHSAFGALSEAYEKFVEPLNINELLNNNDNLRVLDICYGIGYNTKALLNEICKKNIASKHICVDCVDTDKTLMELSPFISSKINFIKRLKYKNLLTKNIKNYSEGNKIVSKNKNVKTGYKISKDINFLLVENLMKNWGEDFLSEVSKNIVTKNENSPFFDEGTSNFYKFLVKNGVQLHQNKNKLAFVHNIYYRYISKRYNKHSKQYNFSNINLNFCNSDIRAHLKSISDVKYDIIMLDGFTPQKCPCIWSLDFFKCLKDVMTDDALIVTYNMSAPVRNAMKLAGLYIGETRNKNSKPIGTIASKNQNTIKYKINNISEGLLATKAGIPYRDKNLSLDNDIIIKNRDDEIKKSDLLSSSKYYKMAEVRSEQQ